MIYDIDLQNIKYDKTICNMSNIDNINKVLTFEQPIKYNDRNDICVYIKWNKHYHMKIKYQLMYLIQPNKQDCFKRKLSTLQEKIGSNPIWSHVINCYAIV